MKILKRVCWGFALILFISALIPFIYGEFNVGGYILLAMGIAFIAFLFFWQIGGKVRVIFTVLYSIVILSILGISIAMVSRAYGHQPPNTGSQTVIVLGAKVVGDRPSRVLGRRLRKAEEYLKKNPEATCIVSGGQGDDEMYPEGEVMRNYLIERGIEPHRIIAEEKSVNTRQNLWFSKELIPENSAGIIIVTDAFHQLRASTTGKTIGFQPLYNLSSSTPIELVPSYWMRDLPGVPLTWFKERVLKDYS